MVKKKTNKIKLQSQTSMQTNAHCQIKRYGLKAQRFFFDKGWQQYSCVDSINSLSNIFDSDGL